MMTGDDYRHFVCIAAGDNPQELMKEYDRNKITQPRLVYRFGDIKDIKGRFIDIYARLLNNKDLSEFQIEYIKTAIEDFQEMDDNEFYNYITNEEALEVDKETGDAYSRKNENGKWSSYAIGKLFSIPFLLKDGREVFQAKKGEIDWEHIHLSGKDIYERAWEMVMEASEPQNDYEATIYDNMKDKRAYFEKFETKENYVISSTAFWGYAFVSEKTGWLDASEEDQFAWMKNFYDLFIKNLDDDTLLTIFECVA